MALIITKEALRILAMNNASCKVFTEKKIRNLQYLTRRARENKDCDFNELVAKLPETGHMYAGIKAFAEYSMKTAVINADVMLRFFGGVAHIEYVLEQAQVMELERRFGADFADKFLFSHILIPLEITRTGSIYTGVYKNGDMSVAVKNLAVHPLVDAKIVAGQKVLAHQALIIGIEFGKKAEAQLLTEQLSSAEFSSAAKNIKTIDYKVFWDLERWTEEIIKKL